MVTTGKKRLICTVIAVAVLVLTSGGVLLAKAVGLHTGVDGVAVTRDGRLSVVCQGPNSSKAAYAVRPIGENDDVFFENAEIRLARLNRLSAQDFPDIQSLRSTGLLFSPTDY